MNLKHFLKLTPQQALMKHAPRKYSIFQRQELQNQELTHQLTVVRVRY